jgi:hypothetical protein
LPPPESRSASQHFAKVAFGRFSVQVYENHHYRTQSRGGVFTKVGRSSFGRGTLAFAPPRSWRSLSRGGPAGGGSWRISKPRHDFASGERRRGREGRQVVGVGAFCFSLAASHASCVLQCEHFPVVPTPDIGVLHTEQRNSPVSECPSNARELYRLTRR